MELAQQVRWVRAFRGLNKDLANTADDIQSTTTFSSIIVQPSTITGQQQQQQQQQQFQRQYQHQPSWQQQRFTTQATTTHTSPSTIPLHSALSQQPRPLVVISRKDERKEANKRKREEEHQRAEHKKEEQRQRLAREQQWMIDPSSLPTNRTTATTDFPSTTTQSHPFDNNEPEIAAVRSSNGTQARAGPPPRPTSVPAIINMELPSGAVVNFITDSLDTDARSLLDSFLRSTKQQQLADDLEAYCNELGTYAATEEQRNKNRIQRDQLQQDTVRCDGHLRYLANQSQADNSQASTGQIKVCSALIDGGTTHHIIRLNVHRQLVEKGLAPEMTLYKPGEMNILFGRASNPEPVLGYINTTFGRVNIVQHMSADALISEIEYTSKGGYIIKDNTNLAIIAEGKLALYGTRDPAAPAGANTSLWTADIEDLFKKPQPLAASASVPQPEVAIRHIMQSVQNTVKSTGLHLNLAHSTSAFRRTLASAPGLAIPVVSSPLIPQPLSPQSDLPPSSKSVTWNWESERDKVVKVSWDQGEVRTGDRGSYSITSLNSQVQQITANSAKPTWTAAEVRTARQAIWAANGSADKLAKTLQANAMARPPDIDPKLVLALGDIHNDPAYRMTHDLAAHPGGSGIKTTIPGHTGHMDILGLWARDKGVHTSLALLITDQATKFTKVYALDNKTTAADAINLYRDLIARKGWVLKKAYFDHATVHVCPKPVQRIDQNSTGTTVHIQISARHPRLLHQRH